MGPLDDYVSSLGAIGRGSGDVTYDPFATGGPGGDPSYFQDLQSPAELKPAGQVRLFKMAGDAVVLISK